MTESVLLELRGLSVRYGPIEAVKGIDLTVRAGEIVALIGANGAGKTSSLRAVAGLIRSGGEIRFDGVPLCRGDASRRVRAGLVLVPEGRGILGQMTVRENLLMGAYQRRDGAAVRSDMDGVLERFPVLRDRLEVPATLLSGGEQQMLAIGRALLARPRLLMLDEPSLGLSPVMVQKIFAIVQDLQRAGITILLVEQKARQTLQTVARAYVLETGRIVAEGTAAELQRSSVIADAFLGGAGSGADRD